MSPAKQNLGLQIIFSIFLGLMVMAFIGVGVYTFYPPPDPVGQEELQDLYRQQEDVQRFKDPTALTDAERDRLTEVQEKIRTVEDRLAAQREVWGRNTSIILIAFATLTMAISLIRSDQLPVISNGLLLGGVFTMIYGVGWIVATGTSKARFFVMTVALAITLVLGYIRFVWRRQLKAGQAGAGAAGGGGIVVGDVGDIEARLEAIEARLGAVGAALMGPKS
ncbi:MAG: hypothetical protein IT332_10995 [Ardenticatenales bacterium]|nr:hypothetical protein [Ardenticatenales bacterium]